MFKNALLNFMVVGILTGVAIFFTVLGHQYACLEAECKRLNTMLETTLTEKAVLQSFINKQETGELSPSTLD
jgi:hypothetical protein